MQPSCLFPSRVRYFQVWLSEVPLLVQTTSLLMHSSVFSYYINTRESQIILVTRYTWTFTRSTLPSCFLMGWLFPETNGYHAQGIILSKLVLTKLHYWWLSATIVWFFPTSQICANISQPLSLRSISDFCQSFFTNCKEQSSKPLYLRSLKCYWFSFLPKLTHGHNLPLIN